MSMIMTIKVNIYNIIYYQNILFTLYVMNTFCGSLVIKKKRVNYFISRTYEPLRI